VTEVNLELYERFNPHVLSDVAERRTDTGEYLSRGQRRWIRTKGQPRRVFVHGEHICFQQEQFHDSDAELRLTMAVAAAEIGEQARLGTSGEATAKPVWMSLRHC
jgi:hypothetical protein